VNKNLQIDQSHDTKCISLDQVQWNKQPVKVWLGVGWVEWQTVHTGLMIMIIIPVEPGDVLE